MVFTSLVFVIFLAVVFLLYWGVKHRTAQNVLLVIAAYYFYGWWDYRFCALMFGASMLDFGVGLGLARVQDRRRRRWLLALGLSGNLGMLGFFKYFNFFADNFQAMAHTLGWHVDPITLHIVLPVGISFYTFQTMAYSIEIYRGRLQATNKLIDYLAYVSFFPQLVAGPIERPQNLLPQFFAPRVFDGTKAIDGCRQILWGFFKKMVVADNLTGYVDSTFSNPAAFSGPELAIASVFFAFEIYCDFSAYSDIAVGTARLFGFQLMRNFAYPYFSQSMGEFWRRWHISLSTWFRDYVYIPLGGNRVESLSRKILNIMTTFLLSGFWHGASWNFIFWGAINGGAVLPEVVSPKEQKTRSTDIPMSEGIFSPKAVCKMLLTFSIVCVGWIFFRAKTMTDVFIILKKIICESFLPQTYAHLNLAERFNPLGAKLLFLLLIGLVMAEWNQRHQPYPLKLEGWPRFARWLVYVCMFWTILYCGTYAQNSFIYFQF